jgi:hypothetical protein
MREPSSSIIQPSITHHPRILKNFITFLSSSDLFRNIDRICLIRSMILEDINAVAVQLILFRFGFGVGFGSFFDSCSNGRIKTIIESFFGPNPNARL